jgi:hypothetical protein
MAVGCVKPHVTLPVVPPDQTPEQRVQMFRELRATSELTTTTTVCRRGCSTTVEKTLYLANGMEVYYPDDVLPAVAPDSIAARAIRNVQEHRRRSFVYGVVALASAVVVFAAWYSSYSSSYERALNGEPSFSAPEKLGLLIGAGGVLVGGIGAVYHYRQVVKYWSETNESYNDGLAQRLKVCVSGLAIVACESVPMPVPASASPGVAQADPALIGHRDPTEAPASSKASSADLVAHPAGGIVELTAHAGLRRQRRPAHPLDRHPHPAQTGTAGGHAHCADGSLP